MSDGSEQSEEGSTTKRNFHVRWGGHTLWVDGPELSVPAPAMPFDRPLFSPEQVHRAMNAMCLVMLEEKIRYAQRPTVA